MKTSVSSASRTVITIACFVLTGRAVDAQTIDNPDLFVLVSQIADEVELIREVMGRSYDDAPRLPASEVSQLEVYFQAQTLFRKANQLAQDHAGGDRLSAPALSEADVTPANTYTVLSAALEQVRLVKAALEIETQVRMPARGSASATGVFMTIVDTNRQLNLLNDTPITPRDVFDQISLAVIYSAGILAQRGVTGVPDTPAFDGYKQPADVYARLLDCIEVLGEVAGRTDVQVLRLSSRRNIPDDIEPGHVYDIARILVAGLALLSDELEAEDVFPTLDAPERVFPTQVYLHAGVLLEQLEQIRRLL